MIIGKAKKNAILLIYRVGPVGVQRSVKFIRFEPWIMRILTKPAVLGISESLNTLREISI